MAMPVVIATNGYGMPVTESDSPYALPVEIATNGYGTPVVVVASGGTPVKGAAPPVEPRDLAWDDNSSIEQLLVWDDENGNPQQIQWDR